MKRPDFPEPVAVLGMGRIWRTEDIETWIAEHRPYLDEDRD